MGRKKSQYLSAEQANWIVDQAISYGLEIWTQDGHPDTDWTQRHLHIRSKRNVEKRFHIGVPDDYLNSNAGLDNKK